MALALVVEREGGWSALRSLLGSDASLLEEGHRYQQRFFLKSYPSLLTSTIKAEVDMVVASLRLSGVPDVSGRLSGNEVILNYRTGVNPLAILGVIMAIAVVIVLFLVGYAIYEVVGVVPGVPAWVKLGLAALGVLWAGGVLRRRLA